MKEVEGEKDDEEVKVAVGNEGGSDGREAQKRSHVGIKDSRERENMKKWRNTG